MIIPAQSDYYTVRLDSTNPKIAIHEEPILAWLIEDSDEKKPPVPITITGKAFDCFFIAHPTGIYTNVLTGEQWKDKMWFVSVMQDRVDAERKLVEQGENGE